MLWVIPKQKNKWIKRGASIRSRDKGLPAALRRDNAHDRKASFARNLSVATALDLGDKQVKNLAN
jgi:hypothetical protein